MSSVTKRISEIKQPRGGYIRPSQFDSKTIDDGRILFEIENIHASVVGMAVDYLTRLLMGSSVNEAFAISCRGAEVAASFGNPNAIRVARKLLSGIKGIDKKSVVNACKMATFDVWFRNMPAALMAKSADETNPDTYTIQNIQTMVQRSIAFWEEYGPIIKDGFTFEENGYTETVNAGDGDFLTKDTIWDFKVSKTKPTNKHTLQLLMYWIMGQHSGKTEFKSITSLGIFNPRLNTIYTLPMSEVNIDTIKTVETEVICY